MAASTSNLITRPCGPEPEICATSMPASLAMRRASGEENTRSPDCVVGAGAGAAGFWSRIGLSSLAAGSDAVSGFSASCLGASALGVSAAAGAGAASPPPLAASSTLSPSAARMAITALTLTPSVPAATTIFATVPSSTASTSIVALSVSISQRTSPEETLSPSLTSHLARLPSSMVGERAGIVMLIGIFRSSPYAV